MGEFVHLHLHTEYSLLDGQTRIIGKTALVISDIDPELGVGQVRVGTEKWSAKSDNGSKISEGTNVKVVGIEGVKLVVSTEI